MRQRKDSWRESAACADRDPDWWDIDQPKHWHLARMICAECPVRAHCLAFALDNPHEWGVFGGIPIARGMPLDEQHRHRAGQPDGRRDA